MATAESNNGLYFIVGGLVVLAVVFGLYFWAAPAAGVGVSSSSPSSSSTVEHVSTTTTNSETTLRLSLKCHTAALLCRYECFLE